MQLPAFAQLGYPDLASQILFSPLLWRSASQYQGAPRWSSNVIISVSRCYCKINGDGDIDELWLAFSFCFCLDHKELTWKSNSDKICVPKGPIQFPQKSVGLEGKLNEALKLIQCRCLYTAVSQKHLAQQAPTVNPSGCERKPIHRAQNTDSTGRGK